MARRPLIHGCRFALDTSGGSPPRYAAVTRDDNDARRRGVRPRPSRQRSSIVSSNSGSTAADFWICRMPTASTSGRTGLASIGGQSQAAPRTHWISSKKARAFLSDISDLRIWFDGLWIVDPEIQPIALLTTSRRLASAGGRRCGKETLVPAARASSPPRLGRTLLPASHNANLTILPFRIRPSSSGISMRARRRATVRTSSGPPNSLPVLGLTPSDRSGTLLPRTHVRTKERLWSYHRDSARSWNS